MESKSIWASKTMILGAIVVMAAVLSLAGVWDMGAVFPSEAVALICAIVGMVNRFFTSMPVKL